ncbi:hypothetical protein AQUCO_00900309v1 [Aquilegia coerulea]|uniref:Rho termination factor N-terminal domain-containing protein n=1 Tax=Aquilegia coerulea TaxID=218851 RepID=A0A2G5ED04_AQUCA|nr:hypothetical protein AQUCO_00900309v1 [Aquilegia coerulea]
MDDQDGQHSDISVTEGKSDALKLAVHHSSQKPDLDMIDSSLMIAEEVKESNVSVKDNGQMLDSSSEPERMIHDQQEKEKFLQGDFVPTTNTESVYILESSPKAESGRTKDIIQLDKNNVKEVGVVDTTSSINVKASLKLKRKKGIHSKQVDVDVSEPRTSTTDKVVTSKSPIKFYKKRIKDLRQPDKLQVQKSGFPDSSGSDSQKSYLTLPGLSQSELTEPKTSVTGKVIDSNLPLKLLKKAKDTVRTKKNRGRELHVNKTDVPDSNKSGSRKSSLMLQGSSQLELDIIDLDTEVVHILPGVSSAPENGIKSNKSKRKRHNQVEVPNSGFSSEKNSNGLCSTSNKKRTKRVAANGVKEPNAVRTYNRFSVDSIFKMSTDELDAAELKDSTAFDERPKLLSCTTNSIIKPKSSKSSKSFKIGDSPIDMTGALIGPHEMRAWTLVDLKSLAKLRGMTGYSKFKKEKLIEILTQVG